MWGARALLVVASLWTAWTGSSPADGSAPRSARREPPEALDRPVQWSVHIDLESVSNLGGGRRRGTTFIGVAHAALSAATERMGLWRGGRFHASLLRIAGGDPSGRRVGDLQGVSNLAAEPAGRIDQLWLRQEAGALGVQGGLIDLNQYFVVTDSAGLLANSSFGILPNIGVDVPASIYPAPGLGLLVDHTESGWSGRLGLFQGDPRRRGSVFHEGAMWIAELERRREGPSRTGLKLGLWRHGGNAAVGSDGGAYAIVEREPEAHAAGRPTIFLQLGSNPGTEGPVRRYLGVGASFSGLAPARGGDELSVGVARAWLHGTAETSYEATWLFTLGPHVSLQPDVQYVARPGGDLPDAVVAIVRVHLSWSGSAGAGPGS